MPDAATSTKHAMSFEDRCANVPAAAMQMSIGVFELGDNGENAKTAPIRMIARSGNPIDHWYWGRIAHDLSGMKLHKSRLPIDWLHDENQLIGYLNKFSTEDGDDGVPNLVCSGALVPWKDSDKATEIVFKAQNGVPYEASIDWGGDGIVIEEVHTGASVEVNGYTLEGPAVVVRQWPLRGVAVCPYGADMHTTSQFSKDRNESVRVSLFSHQKETTMSENKLTAESDKATAEDVEANEKTDADAEAPAEAAQDGQAVEEKGQPEGEATDDAQNAESDGGQTAESDKDVDAKDSAQDGGDAGDTASRAECKRFIAAFGDQGGKWFADGLSFTEAQEKYVAALTADNEKLRKRLAAAGEGEDEPVTFQPEGDASGEVKPGKFSNLPEGLARYAQGIKMPQNAGKETAV